MSRACVRRRWLIAVSLLPSLLVAIYGWDMPQLGFLKDDGVYLATAKGIAEGKGYRDVSLPGEPWQTKYPPIYPAFLSIAWLVGRSFSSAVSIASALNWLALPLFAYTMLVFFERECFPTPGLLTLICLAYAGVADTAHSLLSDMWFAVVALTVLRMTDRCGWTLGGLIAIAYGLRSSAVALFLAVWAYLIWRRRFRDAAALTVIVVPVAAAWAAWSAGHVGPIRDYNDVFRSSYSQVFAYELPVTDMPARIPRHADAVLVEVGRILIPDIFGGKELDWPRRVLAAASLAALVRIPQRYAVFAVIHLGLLLIWPWRPFPRLFLPVLPLLIGGFSIFMREALERWRLSVPISIPASLFALALLVQAFLQFSIVRIHRALDSDLLAAYEWIVANTPDSATFAAYRDATLFLHTGRKAESIHVSVRETRNNPVSAKQRIMRMADWARSRRHRYILVGPQEYQLSPDAERELRRLLAEDPGVAQVHRQGELSIYEIH
jgi:hypothetical protein